MRLKAIQGSRGIPVITCLVLGVVLLFAGMYKILELYLLSRPELKLLLAPGAVHPLVPELVFLSCLISLLCITIALLLLRRENVPVDSEQTFSWALEAIPDSVGIARLSDATLLWINRGFTEVTGYSPEDAIGHSTTGLKIWLYPDDREQLIDTLKQDQVSKGFETTLQRKDGSHVQVLMSGAMITFRGETCVFMMATNISEYRQIEGDLELAHSRYKNFIEMTSDAVIRYDNAEPFDIGLPVNQQKHELIQVVVMECNNTAAQLFAAESAESLVGKHYHELVDVKNPSISGMLDEYLARGYTLNDYVFNMGKRDGIDLYVSANATGVIENGLHIRVWVTLKDVTERIIAEQAIKQSEEKFSKAFHNSPDAIVITSLPEGKVLDVSQGIHRTIGYRPEEIIGKSPLELNIYVEPADREKLLEKIKRQGSVSNDEMDIRHKDGTILSILISSEKIMLDDVPCMITTFRDITYRKRAENELMRYEKIVSTINDSIIVVNDEYCYEYANEQYLSFIGKSGQNVAGKRLEDVLGSTAFSAIKNELDRGFRGKPVSFERWREIRPGKVKCNEVHVTRFKNISDGRWYLLTVGRDITERLLAEEALRQNERRYRSILEATQVIPWELNIKTREVTYIGPQMKKQLGYEPEEWMTDEIWLKYIEPADRENVNNFYNSMLETYKSGEIQYRMYNKNNKTIWIRDIVHYVMDEKGNHLLQGLMVDMSESMEKEMQLAHAQKMEAVGRLTGGIAHDFNNLLTIIRGNIGLLSQTIREKTPDIDEMLDDAISASDDGAQLTEQLLAFSRKQSLKPQIIEVNNQIENSTRMFRRMIGEDVEFNISLAKKNPVAYIDPSKFDNALLNLIINARDAMGSGGSMTVQVGRQTVTSETPLQALDIKPGNYITITVTDNGCGMDAETVKHACEPFFTTKGPDKGSGLGLSMVYGFVNQSGGGIDITSSPDKGTSISLYLPETEQTAEEVSTESEASIIDQTAIDNTQTVLVTEDETRVRKFAVKCLRSLGYRVIEAVDAETAINSLQEDNSIDILFSDNILPGNMNGRDLAGWVMQHYPHVKIILATGFSNYETDEPSVYDGQFPLLRKPYSREELAQEIRALSERDTDMYRKTVH